MAKNQNDLAGSALPEESGGRPRRFLAGEGTFDRRTLWRLGSWGVSSVGAIVVALLAHNSGPGLRHERISASDLARQSQQLQSIAKGNENETRRLSSAVDTLNRDRDRLFARVTALEQGLDSVTGSISQNVAQHGPRRESPQNKVVLGSPPVEALPLPPPDLALADLTPPLASAMAETVAAKRSPAAPSPADSLSANAPSKTSPSANSPPATRPGEPDKAAAVTPAKPAPAKDREPDNSEDAGSKDAQIVVASIPAIADAPQVPSLPTPVAVAHTDFGVDLGSASSIKGLRALWRSVLKSEAKLLAPLHPIIVLKEHGNGKGMQLRLVAGPLADAAAAAKICAVLSENGRTCETAVFDGQHLATNEDGKESGAAVTTKKTRSAHTSSRHRHNPRSARAEEPAPPPLPPPPPPPKPSPFGSFFSH